MGDFVSISLKRGERPKYEDILKRTLKKWNGESKDNREIFKKADVWKRGLELVNEIETLSKSNNPNIKSNISPIVQFKQMILRDVTKEMIQTRKDFKLAEKGDYKSFKKLGLDNVSEVKKFKIQSQIYLVLLGKFRERINQIYADNFQDNNTKKS